MEKIVDREQMEALKVLAETNLKVSAAKGLLIGLQEAETAYLVKREAKALEKIAKAVEDSRQLLNEVSSNYQEVKQVADMVSSFANFLTEGHEKLKEMVSVFNDYSVAWDKELTKQHEEIAEIRQGVKIERIRMDNEKKTLLIMKKALENEKSLIESRQAQLKTALKALK